MLSLVLTLSLPVTVSILGDLDWGPVIGGYVAAVLMAAAYVSIGLFVSSRTDNQIVSLILTALLCGGPLPGGHLGSDQLCRGDDVEPHAGHQLPGPLREHRAGA